MIAPPCAAVAPSPPIGASSKSLLLAGCRPAAAFLRCLGTGVASSTAASNHEPLSRKPEAARARRRAGLGFSARPFRERPLHCIVVLAFSRDDVADAIQ